ncbi:MAG TPA: twin-arginine translocase TatA/TatE family subunit [Blastocatellia bacterium]|nr:twin-arginine translocase TatA/TatE family subunit [Blastocatellia bacterium]
MGLGMPEVIIILVVALVVFGPRKLPELGKSLGHAMAQFRRASEDFKRTWEQEVEVEKVRKTDTAGGGESNYGYNESYDPYNSNSDDSNKLEAGAAESNSVAESSAQDKTEAQVAAAGVETATVKAQPEKKHWI